MLWPDNVISTTTCGNYSPEYICQPHKNTVYIIFLYNQQIIIPMALCPLIENQTVLIIFALAAELIAFGSGTEQIYSNTNPFIPEPWPKKEKTGEAE